MMCFYLFILFFFSPPEILIGLFLSLTDLSSSSQDDDDGHLLALQIIRDLVDKGGDVFLDQLARLGVINKVSTLAGPTSDDENEEEAKPEKVRINSVQIHVFIVVQLICISKIFEGKKKLKYL